jgi:hypothetical protein
MLRLMRRATELSGSDWAYLAVAIFELFIARIRLMMLDGAQIVRVYARAGSSNPPSSNEQRPSLSIERMSWALGTAAAHVPWRADCLVQAMAGHRWLRRHGIEADFVIGVDKTESGGFESHAWLRHRGVIITGVPVDRFTPVVDTQQAEIRQTFRR